MAHSEGVKAAAMAALLAGQGIGEVAKSFKVPRTTVNDWYREASGLTEKNRHKKGSRIAELVEALLETNLETLRLQSASFRDEAWFKGHPPSDVAILHGVVADKTFRILDAYRGDTEEAADDGGTPV